jgi:hypothetical protein
MAAAGGTLVLALVTLSPDSEERRAEVVRYWNVDGRDPR